MKKLSAGCLQEQKMNSKIINGVILEEPEIKEPIIVFISEKKIIFETIISLCSLAANISESRSYEIMILEHDFDRIDKERIQSIFADKKNVSLKIYDIMQEEAPAVKILHCFSYEETVALFLPFLLKACHKIIYAVSGVLFHTDFEKVFTANGVFDLWMKNGRMLGYAVDIPLFCDAVTVSEIASCMECAVYGQALTEMSRIVGGNIKENIWGMDRDEEEFARFARTTPYYEMWLFSKKVKKKKVNKKTGFYLFPFELVEKNSRIIIYGAGKIGKQFVNQINKSKYCELVCVVDQAISKEADGLFRNPEAILKLEYDCIVISVANQKATEQICEQLRAFGVDEQKIVIAKERQLIETGE
jgi:hypothetical protein